MLDGKTCVLMLSLSLNACTSPVKDELGGQVPLMADAAWIRSRDGSPDVVVGGFRADAGLTDGRVWTDLRVDDADPPPSRDDAGLSPDTLRPDGPPADPGRSSLEGLFVDVHYARAEWKQAVDYLCKSYNPKRPRSAQIRSIVLSALSHYDSGLLATGNAQWAYDNVIKPYLLESSCLDRIYFASAGERQIHARYAEDPNCRDTYSCLSNDDYRDALIRLGRISARNIYDWYVDRGLPPEKFAWYQSYEYGLQQVVDDKKFENLKRLVKGISDAMYAVHPAEILWSPIFHGKYERYSSGALRTIESRMSALFSAASRLTRIDLQDGLGRNRYRCDQAQAYCYPYEQLSDNDVTSAEENWVTAAGDAVSYLRLLSRARDSSDNKNLLIAVNMELFVRKIAQGGPQSIDGNLGEMLGRQAVYRARGIRLGHHFSAQQWWKMRSGKAQYQLGFVDVGERSMHAPAITWAHMQGIVSNGCSRSPAKFCPASPASRAVTAAYVLREYHGDPEGGPTRYVPAALENQFADVAREDWYWRIVNDFKNAGFAAGCAAGFCPTQPVTRSQLAAFLVRSCHGPDFTPPRPDQGGYSDVPPEHAFARWIYQAERDRTMVGCGQERFCPNAAVARGPLMTMLRRLRQRRQGGPCIELQPQP